jgi:cell division initiation protein
MTIRPIDVRRKEFKNSLRGYDANQVDDFLDAVADEFERTFSENARMREEISHLRERLEQFSELEGSIQAALVHAERAATDLRETAQREVENLRESARREAELTIREAKARSHQMLADSSGRVERIQESYEALREAKQTFSTEFRQLLQSYMAVMENADVATAKEIEASLRERLDTESIAAAREAAAQQTTEAFRDASSDESAPQAGVESEVEPEEITQRIEPEIDEGTPEEAGPEVEEPEIEPSSAQSEAEQETVATDLETNDEAAEGRSEEPAEEGRAEDFFDRSHEEQGTSGPEGENRSSRAARFLRRRG